MWWEIKKQYYLFLKVAFKAPLPLNNSERSQSIFWSFLGINNYIMRYSTFIFQSKLTLNLGLLNASLYPTPLAFVSAWKPVVILSFTLIVLYALYSPFLTRIDEEKSKSLVLFKKKKKLFKNIFFNSLRYTDKLLRLWREFPHIPSCFHYC